MEVGDLRIGVVLSAWACLKVSYLRTRGGTISAGMSEVDLSSDKG